MFHKTAHRRPIRLTGHDYSVPGTYFVTICVQRRACMFGAQQGSEIVLSRVGRMVDPWWGNIGGRFPNVGVDAYVVMPNHPHGLLRFGWDIDGGIDSAVDKKGRHSGLPLHKSSRSPGTAAFAGRGKPPCLPSSSTTDTGPDEPNPITLGRVMQWFKSATTTDYKVGIELLDWPPYPGRLWQRNYYEHIVRDERGLERIREYIVGNPWRWTDDDEFRDFCPRFS